MVYHTFLSIWCCYIQYSLVSFMSPLASKVAQHLFISIVIRFLWWHVRVLFWCSGEVAFTSLSQHYGWAKFPMLKRINDIPSTVSMTMIYGSRSWVDFNVGYEIKWIRKNAFVDVQVSFLSCNKSGFCWLFYFMCLQLKTFFIYEYWTGNLLYFV